MKLQTSYLDLDVMYNYGKYSRDLFVLTDGLLYLLNANNTFSHNILMIVVLVIPCTRHKRMSVFSRIRYTLIRYTVRYNLFVHETAICVV